MPLRAKMKYIQYLWLFVAGNSSRTVVEKYLKYFDIDFTKGIFPVSVSASAVVSLLRNLDSSFVKRVSWCDRNTQAIWGIISANLTRRYTQPKLTHSTYCLGTHRGSKIHCCVHLDEPFFHQTWRWHGDELMTEELPHFVCRWPRSADKSEYCSGTKQVLGVEVFSSHSTRTKCISFGLFVPYYSFSKHIRTVIVASAASTFEFSARYSSEHTVFASPVLIWLCFSLEMTFKCFIIHLNMLLNFGIKLNWIKWS